MTQHHSVRVKLSNLQLRKLKSETKNSNYVALRLSQNKIGTNFPLNLLLSDKNVSSLYKVFANKPLVKVKLSKIQKSKMKQL